MTTSSSARGCSRVQFPLSGIVHHNGDSDDNGHQAISPTSFAGVDDARKIIFLEARGDFKGWSQGVELPNLGQIERQRTTRRDERRSKEAENWTGTKLSKQSLEPLASPQYDVGETPLLSQRRRGCTARGGDLVVRAGRLSVEGVVCAGDSRFRPSGQRTDPRKIPKSVGISRDHERVQVGKGSYAAVIPGATKSFLGPTLQSPGAKSGDSSVFDRKCHVKTEAPIDGGLHRQRSVDSRRPKNVYPSLEEGAQPATRRKSHADIGARGGGVGDMRTKPVRSRSAHTLLEGSASRLALSTGDDIAFGGEYQSLEPSRELEVEADRSNNVLDGKERFLGKRCNHLVATAKLRRTRAGRGGVNGVDQSGGNSRPISRSSSLEVSRRRRRRTVEVAGAASRSANKPKTRRKMRALVDGRRPTIERVVPDVLCAKSLLIPLTSIDSRTQKSLEGRLELENGRDGKLYVDVKQQKVDGTTASFRAEENTRRNRDAYADREEQKGDATDIVRVHDNRYMHWDDASWPEAAMAVATTSHGNVTNIQVDSIKTKGSAKHADATVSSLLESTRRLAAARVIRRAAVRTMTRRQKGQVRHHGGEGDDLMIRNSEASSVYGAVSSKREGTDQVLAVTEHYASKKGKSRAEMATSAILPRAPTSITTTQERHRNLSRTTRDRRVLAGSTIRVWAARSLLASHLRSRRFANIEFRWEHEVRRIAATRIQSVVRGMEVRREFERATRFALEIHRVARGRAERSVGERRMQKQQRSLEEHQEACDNVKSLFQDHRERWQVSTNTEREREREKERERERQILREEVIAHNGAAAIIQGLWRHHKSGKLLLRDANRVRNLAKKSEKIAETVTHTRASTNPPTPTPRESSFSLVNLIGSEPVNPSYRPSPQGINDETCSSLPLNTKPATPDAFPTLKGLAPAQKPWRPTEAEMSSLYAVWNAFTALLTTFATRRATKTKLARALLTPAAITLATFSQVHRAACIDVEGALTSRAGASLLVSPDPARFQCARSLETNIAVAGCRLAEAMRIYAESLLAAQSAATEAIGGFRTEEIDAAEKYARETVLKAAQKSWEDLHSSMDLLGDAAELKEKMLETLSDTVQDLFVDLASIPSEGLMAQVGTDESLVDHVECSDGIARARSPRQNHQVFPALPDTIARALASSAAGTLLSHPDVLEILSDAGEDLETLEYASLVAEVCGVLLLVTPPITNLSDGHHGETDGDQTKKYLVTPPHEELGEDACLQHGATKPPVSYPARSPSRNNLRAQERVGVLRLIVGRIEATADELVRAMELQVSPRPPEGHCGAFGPSDTTFQGMGESEEGCRSDFSCLWPRYQELLLVRSMTDRLWELAWSVSPLPMDDKQAHESYRERASILQFGADGSDVADGAAPLIQG